MKRLLNVLFILSIAVSSFSADFADISESPYFQVYTPDSIGCLFPLKETNVDANISGVMADVVVKQVYVNECEQTIEAVYIFPGSTRSAVYDMKIKIGERIIQGIVKEKQQARAEYDQAIQDGKTAALLEQHRPNVFQMSVGNILPGDRVEVELRYTEYLIPEGGTYHFVYPGVVGPRYEHSSTPSEFNDNTYQNEKTFDFDINVSIQAGMRLKDVTSSSHEIVITKDNKYHAGISLGEEEINPSNRDFILSYNLKGDEIENGLLLYEGDKENFFLLMMQPPKQTSIAEVPPREYIFIVDVSGSMYGFPLDISKELYTTILDQLRPEDKFNMMFFAGGNYVMFDQSVYATSENITHAKNEIKRQIGVGGTQLLPALERALNMSSDDGRSRIFVVATDGYVTVERQAFDLIRTNLGEANFFSFGIGSSVNRYIIEGIAKVGKGEAFVATSKDEAKKIADTFIDYIKHPVLTDISIDFGDFDVYDVESMQIPDLFAMRPVVITGKYKGSAQGSITLSGVSGNRDYKDNLQVHNYFPSKENAALTYLWARDRIAAIDDYGDYSPNGNAYKDSVLHLGLKYNLLTQYTSFIAIDNMVRDSTGTYKVIHQPLPSPDGVDMSMISGVVTSKAPPPAGFNSMQFIQIVPEVAEDTEMEEIGTAYEWDQLSGQSNVPVEISPAYPGGKQAMKEFIRNNFSIPQQAIDWKDQLVIEITVDASGNIIAKKVIKGTHQELIDELIEVIDHMPAWNPGTVGGVATTMTAKIKIKFPF